MPNTILYIITALKSWYPKTAKYKACICSLRVHEKLVYFA